MVMENEYMGEAEKNEIIAKFDEMEMIFLAADTKRNKWEKMRPYVMWATGKDADTAMIALSLVLKIN